MVATQTVTILEGTPGRIDEVNEALVKFREMIESTGGSVKFWVNIYGGAMANRLVITADHESGAATGAALDRIMGGEVNEHPLQQIQASGAARLVSRSIVVEWNP